MTASPDRDQLARAFVNAAADLLDTVTATGVAAPYVQGFNAGHCGMVASVALVPNKGTQVVIAALGGDGEQVPLLSATFPYRGAPPAERLN